jgi:predicted nucleotidyltransferase
MRLVSRKTIREFAGEIGREFKPDRVVLFGSYADGKPTRDSDVDLLTLEWIGKAEGDFVSADRTVAQAALEHCQFARTQLREALGIENPKKA